MTNDFRDAWTSYWAQHHRSAVGDGGDFAHFAIQKFWTQELERLDPGSTVLNIGAGNGSIERLSAELSLPISFRSVDFATVKPSWLDEMEPARSNRFHFYPNTAAESLPLESASVDVVTAQFALEYCDVAAAMREWVRCARQGSKVIALVHATNSIFSISSQAECVHYAWLLGPQSPLTAAQSLLPFLAQAQDARQRGALSRNPQAQLVKSRYNEAVRVLQHKMASEPEPLILDGVMRDIHQVLSTVEAHSLDASLKALSTLRINIQHAWTRVGAQTQVALDEQGCAQLVESGRSIGVEWCDPEALVASDFLLGWVLRGRIKV